MDPRQNVKDQLRECEAIIKATTEKVAKLKTFLSLYDELLQDEAALPVDPVDRTNLARILPVRRHKSIPDTVEEILADGIPRKTEDLVEMLKERGITMHTKRPVVNLSSTLSREKARFISNRVKGWTLKTARPSSAGTDDGLFINGASEDAH